MAKPTQDQINSEITALKEIKPKVRHYSAFGDNNWEFIEAQIWVLETKASEDGIHDKWNSFDDDDISLRDAALEAHAWLNGGLIENASLANEWAELVQE